MFLVFATLRRPVYVARAWLFMPLISEKISQAFFACEIILSKYNF